MKLSKKQLKRIWILIQGVTGVAEGFSPESNWTWLGGTPSVGNAAGNYGTQGQAASTNWPSGRLYSAMVVHENTGFLYLYGGMKECCSYNQFNDLWRYNLTIKMWTWLNGASTDVASTSANYVSIGVSVASNQPGPRNGHTLSIDQGTGTLYLFGGATDSYGGHVYNDIWKWDPSTNIWTWIGGSSTTNQNGVHGTIKTEQAGTYP